jgi:hypothetical protein
MAAVIIALLGGMVERYMFGSSLRELEQIQAVEAEKTRQLELRQDALEARIERRLTAIDVKLDVIILADE